MANFKPFSLSDAIGAGQKLAAGHAAIQDIATGREKAGKAAVLRQRMAEGDPEAFAELANLDIDQAKKTMDAVKTMDDNKREAFKRQNEAIAKAGTWVMQGQTEQEQRQRYDQAISHMESQGLDVSQYKGNFNPLMIRNSIMQAMTIDQMIESQSQTGMHKGLDKDGNEVFFTQNKISGEENILKNVKPSKTQVHGKDGGSGTGGNKRKAADSNAISKRLASALGATWKEDAKGGLSFEFKTDQDAAKHLEMVAKAEQKFRTDSNLMHGEVADAILKEYNLTADKPKEGKAKKSIGDFLNEQRQK